MERTRKPNHSTQHIPVIIEDDIVPVHFKTGKRKGTYGKYDETVPDRTLELAKIGLTHEQLAIAFGVALVTFQNWLQHHPAVREAYDEGKWIHDHSVQQSLLRRANGFTVPEVKHVEGIDSIGRPYKYTTTTNKYYPPDMAAIAFWLKNRHRGEWRDAYNKHDGTTINVDMRKTLNLQSLSKDEVSMLEDIALKQIEDMNGVTGG